MVADSCASGFAPGDAVKLKLALAIQSFGSAIYRSSSRVLCPNQRSLNQELKVNLPEFPIGASTVRWRGQAA